ncbi:MAG TPA: NAD-binding protein, partial [Mycobacterium sp.]
LVAKFTQYKSDYVLVVPELEEALRLHDEGIRVMVGKLDHPDTYRRLRIENAAMVVTTATDVANTNFVFTVREQNPSVPIFATARDSAAAEILKLAGATYVARLGLDLGQSLARRAIGGDAVAHVIGKFDELLIAEATTTGTPLVGKTIRESRLRELAGVTVVGVWERGRFDSVGPDTKITSNTVLLLAGSQAQIQKYNELFCIYHVVGGPAVIIGGGRVGRAAGQALNQRGLDYRIIEKLPERIPSTEKYVSGDAVQMEVLKQAGFMEAPAVIITPRDDDTNIYLTILCRKLRPDIQIISRATSDRNVSTLHRAGADFVMSYASMGANMIFNLLQRGDILMVAEGLDVFRVRANEKMAGKSLLDLPIRADTDCNVVAIRQNDHLQINPDPQVSLSVSDELILVGTVDAEKKFLERFGDMIEGSASKV